MSVGNANILALDIGDLGYVVVLIIVALSGLVGQALEKRRKAGGRQVVERTGRPSARPVQPPPRRESDSQQAHEEVVEIRLPSGQVIARVRRPRPKAEPAPTPAPVGRRRPSARPFPVVERPGTPSRASQRQAPPATELEHGLGTRITARTVGTERLGKLGKEVHAGRVASDIAVGTIAPVRVRGARRRRRLPLAKLREAVILSEVLRPPLALREPPGPP